MEEFRKIEGWDSTLEPCPFCGSHAEMYEHTPTPNTFQKVVMCSNNGDEDNGVDECPMYMPPGGFYCATKQEARNVWNTRKGN